MSDIRRSDSLAGDSPLVRRFSVRKVCGTASERVMDTVATEEPLEIRIRYWFKDAQSTDSLALTMRTPGNDAELAAGFLLSEGVVRHRDDIVELHSLGAAASNEIVAVLARTVDVENWRLERSTFVNSSCGVCGKRSRDAIAETVPPDSSTPFQIDAALIESLPGRLRDRQAGFAQTGGLHAAALVDPSGHVEALFEDIGRHNALDKLLGSALLHDRIPLHDRVVFLSSRSSFELIQKAAMAGAPVLATVGAPSSLAIETARQYGITLAGFVRDGRFNVYSGEWRIHS